MADKPAPIALSPVTSANVAAIGYDADSQRFAVQFKNGGTYHYAGVPADVAEKVTNANSIGSAVQAHLVKGGYSYARIGKDD